MARSPILKEPFVVGPCFSMSPAKMVNQIVAGKYIELPVSKLLCVNTVHTTTSKWQPCHIEDIEAFSSFFLDHDILFPASMERFNGIQVADLAYLPPI